MDPAAVLAGAGRARRHAAPDLRRRAAGPADVGERIGLSPGGGGGRARRRGGRARGLLRSGSRRSPRTEEAG